MRNIRMILFLTSLPLLTLLVSGISFADNLSADQEVIDKNSKTEIYNLQKVVIRNNGVEFVTISEKELTRFIFVKDKIKHIYAISGELSYDLVDENLYLKPNIIKPINFFITTEKGNTYQILAEPRDIPATQVMIIGAKAFQDKQRAYKSSVPISIDIPEDNKSLVHGSFSSDSVLMAEIRKVVLAIKSNDRTLGFNIKKINKKIKSKSGRVVGRIDSIWSNEEITAEKYHLANVSKEDIALNKANYLAEDIIAVYLEKDIVLPRESTLLILLRRVRK